MHPGTAIFAGLQAVDKLTVDVIVDNETDGISSPCACCVGPSPVAGGAAPEDASVPACSYTSEFSRIVATTGQLDFNRSCYAGGQLSPNCPVMLLPDLNPRAHQMWTKSDTGMSSSCRRPVHRARIAAYRVAVADDRAMHRRRSRVVAPADGRSQWGGSDRNTLLCIMCHRCLTQRRSCPVSCCLLVCDSYAQHLSLERWLRAAQAAGQRLKLLKSWLRAAPAAFRCGADRRAVGSQRRQVAPAGRRRGGLRPEPLVRGTTGGHVRRQEVRVKLSRPKLGLKDRGLRQASQSGPPLGKWFRTSQGREHVAVDHGRLKGRPLLKAALCHPTWLHTAGSK